MNWTELETLCMLCATSGREHAVRDYILQELKAMQLPPEAVTVDRLGNLLVQKKGKRPAKRRVLFSAHMDEVGMMVTDIHADGTLAFGTVGGIDAAAMAGRQVTVGDKGLTGVIGTKPIHHLSKTERTEPIAAKSLCIDIGVDSKEAAEQLVSLGDAVYFDASYREFGDGMIAAKALDDRFGCAILLQLLRQDLEYDLAVAFVVQEEVGLRGAGVAARTIAPEIGIVWEATTAADLPEQSDSQAVCRLGKGAVLSFMDGRTIYDAALYRMAGALCDERGIPWQTKYRIAGGNDAGAIQTAGKGVRVLAVSVPCRYLHSPLCVIRKSDAEACERLALALVSALQESEGLA